MTNLEAINYIIESVHDYNPMPWYNPTDEEALELIKNEILALNTTIIRLGATIERLNAQIEEDQFNGRDTTFLERSRDFARQIIDSLNGKENN